MRKYGWAAVICWSSVSATTSSSSIALSDTGGGRRRGHKTAWSEDIAHWNRSKNQAHTDQRAPATTGLLPAVPA